MFEIVDDTDDDFDITVNDGGDNDDDKRLPDEREEIVEGVEHKGDVSTSTGPLSTDTDRFFFFIFNEDLPTIAFLLGGEEFVVIMVAMKAVKRSC